MKISIVCSSKSHPVYCFLEKWIKDNCHNHTIELVQNKSDLSGGDILFLISCSEIINKADRELYKIALVIHASDLPIGRGWSPHVWQILNGHNDIVVTLLQVDDRVDCGDIIAQQLLHFEGHELFDEINYALFVCELKLMNYVLTNFENLVAKAQDNRQPTYYRKREAEDSRLDPHKSIAEQFNLLRVVDPQRFPAFFDFKGNRYIVKLEKAINEV